MIGRKAVARLCAGLSAVAIVQAAHAQSGPESETVDSTIASRDIVVTARRREEVLQDVPISVSVLSGEQLAQSGVTDALSL